MVGIFKEPSVIQTKLRSCHFINVFPGHIWSRRTQSGILAKLNTKCPLKMSKKATKLVTSLASLLRKTNLPTLCYRRARGDMIEAFKMMKIYDRDVIPDFEFSTSRTRASKQIKQFYFSQSIINMWNRLPSSVVYANTVPQFERRLDTHWSKQEFKYNYRAPPPSALHVKRYKSK